MLRLILMRHGEAESALMGSSDQTRRLVPAGIAAALRCGQEIQSRGFSPDQILCSHADRAVATMEAVVRGAALGGVPSQIIPSFYLAEATYLLEYCRDLDDHLETLLLIGHNPAWSEATTLLSGVPLHLGTAQAALLEYSGKQWLEAIQNAGQWKLKDLVP